MSSQTIELPLNFNSKYRSASTNIVLPPPSNELTKAIRTAVEKAEDAKMRTMEFHCDMRHITSAIGDCYHTTQAGLLKTMRPLSSYDGAYLEPVSFSMSVSVLVWKIIDGKKYVCIIEDLHGGWTAFPAGGAKPGESIVECGIREVREEVGLTVTGPAILRGIREAKGAFGESNILFTVSMKLEGDDTLKIQDNEVKSARWLTINEAIEAVKMTKVKDVLTKFKCEEMPTVIFQ